MRFAPEAIKEAFNNGATATIFRTVMGETSAYRVKVIAIDNGTLYYTTDGIWFSTVNNWQIDTDDVVNNNERYYVVYRNGNLMRQADNYFDAIRYATTLLDTMIDDDRISVEHNDVTLYRRTKSYN